MHESAVTPAGTATPGPRALLARVASLKLTVAAIAWLAGAVAWSFDSGASATWSLAGPLALIAVNLVAAIAVHRPLRGNAPLLVFHLCLVAIVVLVAASRLTYLRGRAEVAQDATFTGMLVEREAGPLHPGGIEALRFVNQGFEIDYAAGRRRADTRNVVNWTDDGGGPRTTIVGDDIPLVLGNYRFYTSPNKGFAPRLLWTPKGGMPTRGTIHLPPYPVFESVQTVDWTPRGAARQLVVELLIDEVLIDPLRATRFTVPREPRLRVHDSESTVELRRGQSAEIAGGTLVFEDLVTWMGYSVHYDPAMPWLLAACVLACIAMGAYFLGRFRARPWNP